MFMTKDIFQLVSWPLIQIIAIILLYFYFTRNHNYWSKLGIKGPKPIIALGTSTHERYGQKQHLMRKYGKIYGVYFGNTPVLTVADPVIAKNIMIKNFEIFMNKREKHLISVRNRNLSVIESNEWKPMRTIISKIFTERNLRILYPKMTQSVHQLTDALQGFAKCGAELELRQIFQRFVTDILAKSILNMNINSHINECDKRFAVNCNQMMLETNQFFDLVKLVIPLQYLQPLKYFGVENVDKTMSIINVCKTLINERKDCDYNEDQEFDYVKHMIRIRNKSEKSDQESLLQQNLDITDEDIAINFWLFLMAANFMLTNTLSAIVYEFAVNEDKQQLLYEVLNGFWEKNDEMDVQLLTALPYLNAVVLEAIRLHVSTLSVERVAAREYTVPNTDVVLAKGQAIQIPIRALLHCEHNFPNASAFIPERHLMSNGNTLTTDSLAFSFGPRNCPAMRFALIALKLCTAQLIRKYRFYRTVGTDVPMKITKHVEQYVPAQVIVGISERSSKEMDLI